MALESDLQKVKEASRRFVMVDDALISDILRTLADRLEERTPEILEANAIDLKKIESTHELYDRLLLNEERIKAIAESVREVAGYDSPIGVTLEEKTIENGMQLKKVSVPMGVVGAIFEARPNVTVDTFVLCFKSKNACVMKGGSMAENSNEILVSIINEVIQEMKGENFELNNVVLLLDNDRALVEEFLKKRQYVDVIVPRGGQGLIDFVRETSKIPVIETGRGVVHTYFDKDGDIEKEQKIVFNAKTQRPSVCNSLDTLIIHEDRLEDLPILCGKLSEKDVEIFADEQPYVALGGHYPAKRLRQASEENFGKEYLSLKMSIKTSSGVYDAVSHVNKYGSGHSEAIITENDEAAQVFLTGVDAAAVYLNASTRFTDGAVFGLGAEVGISTQKLHARGPMGIKEITSYKWIAIGDGQIR